MDIRLNEFQLTKKTEFRNFVERHIAPHACAYDAEQSIPRSLLETLATHGYVGMTLPTAWGGQDADMVTYGLLHEEISRSLSSLSAVVTVTDMVSHAISRWGTSEQKARWLPDMAAGRVIGAFAVSEPNAGSDVRGVESRAERTENGFVITGQKRWITAGRLADVFIVLARLADKPTAFLVERSRPGVSVTPVSEMLGFRAAMLGDIDLSNCEIARDNLISRPGFGVESVIQTALDLGRFTIACNSLGLAQACLDMSIAYADQRHQFGVPLSNHQLIAELLTDMICNVTAVRLMCWQAGYLRDSGDPDSVTATLMAKYCASRTAVKVACDAVQIHGAKGCSSALPLERFFRDAKIMEIIEGSNQIQQTLIARLVRKHNRQSTEHCSATLAATAC